MTERGTTRRVLIAGIGNIFLGDDAFGCEVARRLLQREPRAGVDVVDFGIRGLDLAYAITSGYETAILIDAFSREGSPGTVTTLQLSLEDCGDGQSALDTHSMHPLNVLRLVKSLGGTDCRLFLVGCEPLALGNEFDGAMGLSGPVKSAIEIALQHVDSLVEHSPHSSSAE